jgi:hypothetical protein
VAMSVQISQDLNLSLANLPAGWRQLYRDLRSQGFTRRDANIFLQGLAVGEQGLEGVLIGD